MPNTYACKLVSNPNVPIFLPRVCTLLLFIITSKRYSFGLAYPAARGNNVVILQYPICICASSARRTR